PTVRCPLGPVPEEKDMLKKVLAASAIAVAGGVLFAGSPAMASEGVNTSGVGSVLSGNQAVLGLDLPVNVCGNAISILGISGANCIDSGATAKNQILRTEPSQGATP